MRPVGKASADFGGWMLDGTARGVLVEVKHVEAKRFPVSRLEEHQRAALEKLHRAGGVAVVLVVHRRAAWAIGWWVIANALLSGVASIGLDELAGHGVRDGIPYLQPWAKGTKR